MLASRRCHTQACEHRQFHTSLLLIKSIDWIEIKKTPNVQFFSSNPRNTAITIRGLGTSFGLTNDGLESGVGYYIDQVYYSRPAATTFDLFGDPRTYGVTVRLRF